jgi:GT2 family glycosyltransferase/glycosyltransferase involved in cell wall biosynthesis
MRILFVVHGFPPEATGGTEIYASGLAQALWRRGHEVIVLAREARTDEPEYRVHRDRAGEVDVVRVNHTFREARSFEHTYRNAKIDAIAGALLDEERPDVVHVHHFTCLSTGIVGECVRRGIPFVLTLNDYWLLCHRGQLLDLDLARCPGPQPDRCAACAGLSASGQPAVHLAARGLRAIERHAPKVLADAQRRLVSGMSRRIVPESAATETARRLDDTRRACESATRILAPSRTILEQFERFGIPSSRMIVQQQGIDIRHIASSDRPLTGPLRLGFIGSVMASKAPHVLLEAVAGLPADRVSLTIAGEVAPYHGDDSYGQFVRPLLKHPGVEWLGRVAHDRIPTLLASLDVLVVPSVWIENSPFVIKEAFAAGVPVVASNLGGMAELVEDGRNGLLFEAGDAADLRRVIARLLDEPLLLARLREGLPRVRSIDEDAAWTQSLYEEALATTPARPAEAARPSIAAVVLNYNTPDDTLLAVRSLQASRRTLDHLIVVDNGPGDACEQALAPWKDAIRFIRSPGNVGFSAGCNIGIRAALDAGADMVLLVNSDAVLAPHALERLEHALAAAPEAGLAAPLIVSRAEPGIVGSAGIAYSMASGRMRHEGFGARTDDLCEEPAHAADVVSGCVMLIRKPVFEEIGVFDERYFYSFEDIEFCLRARRAGLVSLLVPSALAYHEGHRSIGPASASRLYYAARNHLLLAQSALPLTGLRAFARAAGIVVLNLAYALRAPGLPRLAALQAVAWGTLDHLKGRYGNDSRQAV